MGNILSVKLIYKLFVLLWRKKQLADNLNENRLLGIVSTDTHSTIIAMPSQVEDDETIHNGEVEIQEQEVEIQEQEQEPEVNEVRRQSRKRSAPQEEQSDEPENESNEESEESEESEEYMETDADTESDGEPDLSTYRFTKRKREEDN